MTATASVDGQATPEAPLRSRSRTYSWDDPMEVAAARHSYSGAEMLQAIVRGDVAPPPIAVTLDYSLTHIGDGEATFEIEPAEFHFNPLGTVHGGVISTLLDSALGCAVQTKCPEGVTYTTVDLNVTFIRPVLLTTGRLYARAETINVGRKVGTARAELTDADGKIFATATTSCLIFPIPGAAPQEQGS